MHKLKSAFPIVFAAVTIAVISGVHGQLMQALASAAMLAALCATVYPATRYVFGSGASAVLFAFPAGYLIHSLGLSLAAWAGGFRAVTLACYVAAAVILAAVTWRKASAGTEPVISWDPADRNSLLLWLVATAAVTAPAFLNVGAETSHGFAYRAYFNTDVFRNMATAGSLARTGIPPENPYFAGQDMHYYWLFHVIPAFWTLILPGYRVEFLFVQFALATALAFAAVLWGCARSLSLNTRSTRWLLALFLLGGSYEGLYVLNHLHEKNMQWQQFTTLNVDGILRWVEKLPQVDMLFRPLLYAPQHLMAVIVFLMLFLLWPRAASALQRMALLVLVFVSVGFSAIVGALNFLAVAALLLVDALRRRSGFRNEILLGGILGLCFLLLYVNGFSMFKVAHGDLKLVLNMDLLKQFPAFFLFQWGAVLIFGVAGLIFWTRKDARYLLLVLFLILSTAFMVFLQIDVPGLSDVSLKAGYIHHAAMLLLAAKFLDQGRSRAWLLASGLLLAVAPASVTTAMDVYNSQDIGNAKFTTYIARPQMELYRWMRDHLPPGARVQDFFAPGSTFIESYVSETPPFANRSIYMGDVILSRIFQTPQKEIEARQQIVENLVESEDALRISHLAGKAGIHYLVSYPRRNNPLDSEEARRHFQLVMEDEKWRLYKVVDGEIPVYHERGDYLAYDPEESKPTMTSIYGPGFHSVERLPGGDPARWMSQHGTIRIVAEKEMKGILMFLTHSYVRSRTLELFFNGRRVWSATIGQTATKAVIPVIIPRGESEIRLHCPEGPEKGPGEDNRLLSVKVWQLQFRPSA